MGWGYGNIGGGSAGLNFKIVSNPKPASPSENTIWVDTPEPITAYTFSATEPTDPVESMVWFRTGTTSTVAFDALKKGGIMIYPMVAMQYIGGKWMAVTAKSYQDEKWVDWINWDVYLLKDGVLNPTLGEIRVFKEKEATTATVQFVNGVLRLHLSGSGYAVAYSEREFDITNVRTLKATTAQTGPVLLGLSATNAGYKTWWNVAPKKFDNLHANSTTEIDVSNVTGHYYLAFAMTNDGTTDILEIGME